MRPQGCQEMDRLGRRRPLFPQPIEFKPVSTYTAPMAVRPLATAMLLLFGVPLLLVGHTHASSARQASIASAQSSQSSQGPAFRAGVDVVSLNVTVTDASSKYVTDLKREDF